MKRQEELKILKGNTVQLPQKLIDQLMLKIGETAIVEWESENFRNKCFSIKEDNKEELFNEGFYCIPERVFEHCELPLESIQIIMDKGSITLTTSDVLIASLGKEVLECLMNQGIDFSQLADDLADSINESIYEDSIQDS